MTSERWKFAYTTRRVRHEAIASVVGGDEVPRAGDLVLAEVLKIGQHARIELIDGRRAQMFRGDRIVIAYGNRYAPDQFEGVVPEDLGECHLLAAGGVAGRVLCQHNGMNDATRIAPIGLLYDVEGRRMNLRDYALGAPPRDVPLPPTIAVVGTSMNSGKTTVVASMVRGLRAAGLNAMSCKITGTGAGGDAWLMKDSGAELVLDFTDAGAVSTSLLTLPELEEIMDTLLGHLAAAGAEAIVFEVADGLLQPETAALVAAPAFRAAVDAVIFASGEAMGACGGVTWLQRHGLPVIAASGLMTSAPLAVREAGDVLPVPVFSREDLETGAVAYQLLPQQQEAKLVAA